MVLLYSVNSEPVRPIKTLYFFGNQNVPASGDEALPQIACLGPLCTEVKIQTVKCEGVSFDADYKCHSPDISSEDGLHANYQLKCIGNKFDQENCYVEVIVERFISMTKSPPPEAIRQGGVNFVHLLIAFVLSQIVLGCVTVPIVFFCTRSKTKPQM